MLVYMFVITHTRYWLSMYITAAHLPMIYDDTASTPAYPQTIF